jgi:hypothetical protein
VRTITEGGVAVADANARALIDLERELDIAWEGALQDAALGSRIAIDAANAVYVYGHWPLIILAGVMLFRYRRPHYFRLRDACLLSALIGLVIFGVFPVTPPDPSAVAGQRVRRNAASSRLEPARRDRRLQRHA